MFFEYAKTFFQFVYAFCTSDYGKIKMDDEGNQGACFAYPSTPPLQEERMD
jgi:hypothetical protein